METYAPDPSSNDQRSDYTPSGIPSVLASLTLPKLLLIFLIAAAFVWVAGVLLSNITDVLSSCFGLGEAVSGNGHEDRGPSPHKA
jgi:hypothetical protein